MRTISRCRRCSSSRAARWTEEPEAVLAGIRERFPDTPLAVRSSACGEDSGMASLAGAFDSVLHVPSQDLAALRNAIGKVVSRYEHDADQVLVQPMIPHVALSGRGHDPHAG